VLLRGLLARPGDVQITLRMPGRMHTGPLPPATTDQVALAARLRTTVEHLAVTIGERNMFVPERLREAECWLGERLQKLGKVQRQPYRVGSVECVNLWIDFPGSTHPEEIVVVGAHYDSVRGCPAANDNGTGVAATLEIAEQLAAAYANDQAARPARTLRIVLFVNEEPPHFWTEKMGSLVFARACKERGDRIVAMLTPETIGCFSDAPNSQSYPIPLGRMYPTTGNFIAFIGMGEAGELVRKCVGVFRKTTPFPCIGAALPGVVPGVGSSDHWSFWRMGYPALMITDTAPFRYRYYHTPQDTPDKIDFDKCARVVDGLIRVVSNLLDEDA
jgi:hypothetical protein